MEGFLSGQRICRWFGGVRALDDVDFHLERGEILGLIGPNGAGKTTLLNVVSGLIRPSTGELRFKGKTITGLAPHRIAHLGIARSFQGTRNFSGMTVEEHLLVGALFGTSGERDNGSSPGFGIEEVVRLIGMDARRTSPVSALSIIDRKRVDLGRALAMNPDVLLLDELMAGMDAVDLEGMMRMLHQIHSRGVSLIVVEHVMRVIMSLCHRVIVLHHGRKIADGHPDHVVRDRGVIEAYLGPRYQELTDRARPAE
jgi:branched-chain amino acid transport system ATP-binding protein